MDEVLVGYRVGALGMGQAGEGAGVKAAALTLDKRQIGAAASKLVSASVGEIVVVFSRSPAHKHYSLADVEWMILPAVFRSQFYVAEAANAETGFRAPIAVATWALVSDEVDQRLASDLSHRVRLRPDEWKSGEVGWIVDLVGDRRGIAGAVEWLKAGPFKERTAKIVVRDAKGATRVETLERLASAVAAKETTV
jgi:hemolysin-activating ACP:hemolysin acyltransferase